MQGFKEFTGGRMAWKIVVSESLQPPGWIDRAEVSLSCPLSTATVGSHTHQRGAVLDGVGSSFLIQLKNWPRGPT